MIRVFYQHPNPAGGFYEYEHSTYVADMKQFELRVKLFAREYGLVGVRITRVEPFDTSYENAAADYYAKYGTAGEF